MNPENEVIETNENQNYIDAINELKANTVDKTKYEKLKEENKQLLNTLVQGGQLQVPEKEEVDLNALREDIAFNCSKFNNLEYWTKILKLREAVIDQGGRDPLALHEPNAEPTELDYATAEREVQLIKDCMEYADGDAKIFDMELTRRIPDLNKSRR